MSLPSDPGRALTNPPSTGPVPASILPVIQQSRKDTLREAADKAGTYTASLKVRPSLAGTQGGEMHCRLLITHSLLKSSGLFQNSGLPLSSLPLGIVTQLCVHICLQPPLFPQVTHEIQEPSGCIPLS